MTSRWLFVMVDHWLMSGMERSLARWEESQGMRAELNAAKSKIIKFQKLLVLVDKYMSLNIKDRSSKQKHS